MTDTELIKLYHIRPRQVFARGFNSRYYAEFMLGGIMQKTLTHQHPHEAVQAALYAVKRSRRLNNNIDHDEEESS